MTLDVLVLATHPDDAESTCGGTIAKLVARGARVGVLDASRGEMGTRGTPDERKREAAAAARSLGIVRRDNLGLPDARIVDSLEAREAIAEHLRTLRPALLIAPWWQSDLHPDHAAVGRMARQAYFLAGLRKLSSATEPHRPRRVLYYPSHDGFRPDFVVALTEEHFAAKIRAVRCYGSQVKPASSGDRGKHFVHGMDFVDRMEIRGRYFGSLIASPFGEPFAAEGTLPDGDPLSPALLESAGSATLSRRKRPRTP